MYRFFLVTVLFSLTVSLYAQNTDGMTGLLHMPSGEMQRDGTFMFGGNYLSWKNVPFIANGKYRYNTFNYYLNITILKCLELSYVCTLNKGVPNSKYWPKETWGKFRNQDRHFAAKIQIIKEEHWFKYMPSIVLGVSDPITGEGGEYTAVEGEGNGYFNCWYIAATKHFAIPYGKLGMHLAYLYNQRTDNPLNKPAVGVSFSPTASRNVTLIMEYDAQSINIGAMCSLWNEHVNLLFELQECQYLSVGLSFKVNLLGNNYWKNK